MFDRALFVQGGATHNHHITQLVDPSVQKGARFLREVEQEAEKTITNRVLMGAEGFTANVARFEQHRDNHCMQLVHYIAFEINGRQFKEVLKTNDMDRPMEAATIIANALSAAIMTEIFEKLHWSAR